MEDKYWKTLINKLIKKNESKLSKYQRNLEFYIRDTKSITTLKDYKAVGYNPNYETGNTWDIQENVIASCIDTLTSKIASQKVRPYFNTINGSYIDFQIAVQSQQYFDILFDELNVNKLVTNIFRDACIFEKGYAIADGKKIERALPWEVYIDPAEETYGKLTKLVWKQYDYPTSLLDIETEKESVTLYKVWDITKHKKVTYIKELELLTEEDYKPNVIPLVTICYSDPVFGSSSTSVVDMLIGIQTALDELLRMISKAAKRNPALIICKPSDGNTKVSELSNEIGQVMEYTPTPNMTGSPITTVTNGFMDGQYFSYWERLKQDAYELVGISQLSAMSKKPTGLDSGVALSTMENIESDRFETQLNSVIRAYVDIAKICIATMPSNEDILPVDKKRLSIKWSQIVKASQKMNIQYSAAESLSKDPSTKLEQLQKLAEAGIIPAASISRYLQLPDLESGYSMSNNALGAVMSVINDCIMNDSYDIPPYIPIPMLREEIINMALSLRGANFQENKGDIEKLMKLYQILMEQESDMQSGTTTTDETITGQVEAEMESGTQLGAGGEVLPQTEAMSNVNENQVSEVIQ